MRSIRRGAIVGLTAVGSVLAIVVAVDCAAPTQIIIDVVADKDLCEDTTNPLAVGFGVTKEADVDKSTAPLEDFQNGCKVKAQGVVGTMVIKPSDDKNATIGVRVVAAVGGDPNACQTDLSNCIVSTRLVTFQPGQTVRETVALSGACKGEVCGENQDCVAGKCVDRTAIQDDGGVEPDAGHPTDPDVFVPLPDTGVDSSPFDPCTLCKGGSSRSCSKGVCTIVCADDNACQDQTLCAPGLTCNIVCNLGGSCTNTHCSTNGTCNFDCSGATASGHCTNIQCDASTCNANCGDAGVSVACLGVDFEGQADTITCVESTNGLVGCDNVKCNGKGDNKCTRTCGLTPDAGGCGDAGECIDQKDPGCTGFILRPPDPPDPDAGGTTMH